jgi:hypothetical protein
MGTYDVDRNLLASKSTEEILRILQEERDDYTPEAIRIFEKILEARGIEREDPKGGSGPAKSATWRVPGTAEVLISSPGDAIKVMNDLLSRVLNGTLEPEKAQVASNIVLGILRAIEQDLMTESEEDS